MISKKSLAAFQGASPASGGQWRGCLCGAIRQAGEAGAAVKRRCAAAGVSRASYYRGQVRPATSVGDMAVRDELQKIALQFPPYGYRRITPELKRRGHRMNHKRALRLMRADNLLCLRRRSFVRTTDSAHGWPAYANLAAQLETTGRDQLWVADLTYIRLGREFAYLAVVLDAWSRRVVGWALGETWKPSWR
jgi:putative transposase